VEDSIGVGAATMELVAGIGAGVRMGHWLSWVRVFDSLKDAMVVFGGRKRKCCDIRRGWDGGAVCTRPPIATKRPCSKGDLPGHAFKSGRDGADRLRRISRSIWVLAGQPSVVPVS